MLHYGIHGKLTDEEIRVVRELDIRFFSYRIESGILIRQVPNDYPNFMGIA
ncbi:hypothetical protein [Paenibacillus periandrae]|uniref:hypothetical protein n=1 Tax=Paenibacillus periandrae TaxID=1761741 RepID=UPI001F08EEEA|nr:hypothetical protein [Paenibacillus periandrae]